MITSLSPYGEAYTFNFDEEKEKEKIKKFINPKRKNVIIQRLGFVGSNLIKSLLKKTNNKIISLDNYSSGNKKNHIN
jgi:hypothetical protein